jgi:hypothetical protein
MLSVRDPEHRVRISLAMLGRLVIEPQTLIGVDQIMVGTKMFGIPLQCCIVIGNGGDSASLAPT